MVQRLGQIGDGRPLPKAKPASEEDYPSGATSTCAWPRNLARSGCGEWSFAWASYGWPGHSHHFSTGQGLLISNQLIFYALLFGSLAVWLRIRDDRPFWLSLGWKRVSLSPFRILLFKLATASVVAIIGVLVRVPTTLNEISKLIAGRASLLLIGTFAITLGSLCEELAFRGFP